MTFWIGLGIGLVFGLMVAILLAGWVLTMRPLGKGDDHTWREDE